MSKYEVTIPEYAEFKELIVKRFEENGLSKYVKDDVILDFYKLTCLLIETNSRMNLTAIKDLDGIIVKHYCDCLFIADMLPQNAKLLDVGCGGGFPTLPVAIVRRDVSILSLDSTAKKLTFVDSVSKELSLSVRTLCARAEEAAKDAKYRERFDVVSARAVSSLDVLSELCIPFLKVGGSFIAMKGSQGNDEYQKAKKGITTLGGGEVSERIFMLDDMTRYVYEIKKIKKTPEPYPRAYAKICKNPL